MDALAKSLKVHPNLIKYIGKFLIVRLEDSDIDIFIKNNDFRLRKKSVNVLLKDIVYNK